MTQHDKSKRRRKSKEPSQSPKPATRRGRPLALDATKKQVICSLLTAGASRTAAAQHVGCSRRTIYNETRRDHAFLVQMVKAEADYEVALIARIGEAARSKTQWRAAAWLLERRCPEQFRLRNPKTLTSGELEFAINQVVEVLVESLDDAKQAEIIERIAEVLEEIDGEEPSAAEET